MINLRTSLFTTIIFSNLILLGCANDSPKLGENVRQMETEEGLKLTQADDRRILPNGKLAGTESFLVEAELTVKKIDYKTRKLTVLSPKGEPIELVVGPEVRNFNQIKTGDKVQVEYLFSLAFEVRKPTSEEIAANGVTQGVLERARLGEMPAAGAAQGSIKIAKVQAIDKTNQTVSIREISSGTISKFKARYPENLEYVKVGDSVVLTITEAIASNVERIK